MVDAGGGDAECARLRARATYLMPGDVSYRGKTKQKRKTKEGGDAEWVVDADVGDAKWVVDADVGDAEWGVDAHPLLRTCCCAPVVAHPLLRACCCEPDVARLPLRASCCKPAVARLLRPPNNTQKDLGVVRKRQIVSKTNRDF